MSATACQFQINVPVRLSEARLQNGFRYPAELTLAPATQISIKSSRWLQENVHGMTSDGWVKASNSMTTQYLPQFLHYLLGPDELENRSLHVGLGFAHQVLVHREFQVLYVTLVNCLSHGLYLGQLRRTNHGSGSGSPEKICSSIIDWSGRVAYGWTYVVSKYVMLLMVPECLPRSGMSHSIPTHNPE